MVYLVTFVLTLGLVCSAKCNDLVNGGFEMGDLTGWNVDGRDGWADDTREPQEGQWHFTSITSSCDGRTRPDGHLWQNVTILPCEPGWTIDFSGYVKRYTLDESYENHPDWGWVTVELTVDDEVIWSETWAAGDTWHYFEYTTPAPVHVQNYIDVHVRWGSVPDDSNWVTFDVLFVDGFVLDRACGVSDLDDDERVDFTDFALLAGQWSQEGTGLSADFNVDNVVDMADLKVLTGDWLEGTTEFVLNGMFEQGYDNGIAVDWSGFSTGATLKANPRLGRIGGGIYGTEYVASGQPWPWNLNCDWQTLRLHGKTHVIDLSRFDVVTHLQDALGPEVITIGKLNAEAYFGSGQQALEGDPYANGQEFADYCYQTSQIEGHWPHAYYGLNEPHVNDPNEMRNIALFGRGFNERLHELGLQGVVMNHSIGTPGDLNNMLLDEVRDLFAIADYVGYHSGGGPEGVFMCHPDSLEWHALRWRKIKQMYDDRGWRSPPVIYTEATTWGANWHGEHPPEAIRDDIICLYDHMAEDDWSAGLCEFCTGNWEGQPWHNSNISNYPGWTTGDYHIIVEPVRQYNMDHPVDSHSGTGSQEILTESGPADAGIVQAIATQIGVQYHFSGWFRHEFTGGWPQDAQVFVGFDFTGQTVDPDAATVNYTGDLISAGEWNSDQWYQFETDFVAQQEATSVWLRVVKPDGVEARVYFDDISVTPGI
jgi:hypothetical protein